MIGHSVYLNFSVYANAYLEIMIGQSKKIFTD
jgi:hypothetical protein